MTLLLTIRHGPTAWNRDGRIQGRTDVPLSPEGRARVRAWRLPEDWNETGDAPVWFASPLARAQETAALLGGLPRSDDRLAEMRYGDWEGRIRAEVDAEMLGSVSRWDGLGLDYRPPGGGESPRDVQTRLRPFLAERAADGRPAIAVCHKGVIRALYALAVDWDMTVKPPARLEDDCGQLFRLGPDGGPAVVRLNLALLAQAAPA
jgi:probable phosphoglycerate mutase